MMLNSLSLSPSFGFGDRIGLATPGHIAAVKGTKFAPIFAQQSVRENTRLGRTPQQVMDDAKRAVEAAGWDAPWGADADHLKTVDDLPAFVAAGYTFFTIDSGAYVVNTADTDPFSVLLEKAEMLNWDELTGLYLSHDDEMGLGQFTVENLSRAVVKYGRAIQHISEMYKRLSQMKEIFDFEVSIDETDSPTTPLEHYFIASELNRLRVRFTSLAPRFSGRFEKGVDYIGDLAILDAEMAQHAAVMTHFGTYKLSLHSGSDKFSVYPLLAKHWGNRMHVKTSGTSYLEALRTLAETNPVLFKQIWTLALECFPADRASYHVSADVIKVSVGGSSADLLDEFHAREILHVTFGSALTRYGMEIKAALRKNEDRYYENLQRHFCKHLDLLK